MPTRTLLLTTAIALSLSACATNDDGTYSHGRATMGAVLGAGAGALGGYFSSGNDDDRRKNAMIGAGIGVLAGGAIGNYMDKQQAELAQDLQGSGVELERQGDNLLLTMPSHVTFGFNEANLSPNFTPVLANVADTLKQYPSTMIDVVGHTDSVGEEAYNQGLSERRAQAVTTSLINQGVQASRLVVRGVGEGFPVASNATEAGRAQNRRVEILIAPIREGL